MSSSENRPTENDSTNFSLLTQNSISRTASNQTSLSSHGSHGFNGSNSSMVFPGSTLGIKSFTHLSFTQSPSVQLPTAFSTSNDSSTPIIANYHSNIILPHSTSSTSLQSPNKVTGLASCQDSLAPILTTSAPHIASHDSGKSHNHFLSSLLPQAVPPTLSSPRDHIAIPLLYDSLSRTQASPSISPKNAASTNPTSNSSISDLSLMHSSINSTSTLGGSETTLMPHQLSKNSSANNKFHSSGTSIPAHSSSTSALFPHQGSSHSSNPTSNLASWTNSNPSFSLQNPGLIPQASTIASLPLYGNSNLQHNSTNPPTKPSTPNSSNSLSGSSLSLLAPQLISHTSTLPPTFYPSLNVNVSSMSSLTVLQTAQSTHKFPNTLPNQQDLSSSSSSRTSPSQLSSTISLPFHQDNSTVPTPTSTISALPNSLSNGTGVNLGNIPTSSNVSHTFTHASALNISVGQSDHALSINQIQAQPSGLGFANKLFNTSTPTLISPLQQQQQQQQQQQHQHQHQQHQPFHSNTLMNGNSSLNYSLLKTATTTTVTNSSVLGLKLPTFDPHQSSSQHAANIFVEQVQRNLKQTALTPATLQPQPSLVPPTSQQNILQRAGNIPQGQGQGQGPARHFNPPQHSQHVPNHAYTGGGKTGRPAAEFSLQPTRRNRASGLQNLTDEERLIYDNDGAVQPNAPDHPFSRSLPPPPTLNPTSSEVKNLSLEEKAKLAEAWKEGRRDLLGGDELEMRSIQRQVNAATRPRKGGRFVKKTDAEKQAKRKQLAEENRNQDLQAQYQGETSIQQQRALQQQQAFLQGSLYTQPPQHEHDD